MILTIISFFEILHNLKLYRHVVCSGLGLYHLFTHLADSHLKKAVCVIHYVNRTYLWTFLMFSEVS